MAVGRDEFGALEGGFDVHGLILYFKFDIHIFLSAFGI